MQPIYTHNNTLSAYQLNWSASLFWREEALPEDKWLIPLKKSVEKDDVRILQHRVDRPNVSQFLVSTKPYVKTDMMIRSVKGRLQHIIKTERPKAFRRNFGYRSVGSATREMVEDYIEKQPGHHPMADPRVQARLCNCQRKYPETDLSKPRRSSNCVYWYNLHMSLVTDWREMELSDGILSLWGDTVEKVARKYGHMLSRVGILPEHLHVSMNCIHGVSPGDVALSYMNNLAFACGMRDVFKYSFYIGTIGEYNLGVFG